MRPRAAVATGTASCSYPRCSAAATAGLLLLGALTVLPALRAAPALPQIIGSMDAAAKSWKGMRSQVTWTRYRSLVDEETVESGRIAVRRERSGKVELLLEFVEPTNYYFRVQGTTVEIYKPKIKTIQEYDLSKSRDTLENALLIGFGASGTYLHEHYEIEVEGEETIAGQNSVRLDLRPRDPAGRLNNQRLMMWVSTSFWQPVQLKIFERNPRDYRLYVYAGIEINPKFAAREFRLDLAPGTRREKPQR